MHKVKNGLATALVVTAGIATVGIALTMAAAGFVIGSLVLLALKLKVAGYRQAETPETSAPSEGAAI